jgi:hypothetical protein
METGKIVWLASYPKSGNTWVRLLLGNLLGQQEQSEEDSFTPVPGISSSRAMFEYYVGVNSYDLTPEEADRSRPDVFRRFASDLDDLYFIKAHDSYHLNNRGEPLFPAEASRGAIYIVRDPLDVAVSYTHHRGQDGFDHTVEVMNRVHASIGGKSNEQLRQLLSDWSSHFRSWTEQSEIPVLVVRYEDMKADTAGQLQRIIDFIGLQPSDFAMTVEAAVEAARFERLQSIEAEKGFAERPQKSQRFFRSGTSGEGRAKLSPELQKSLISKHRQVMQQLGYLTGD